MEECNRCKGIGYIITDVLIVRGIVCLHNDTDDGTCPACYGEMCPDCCGDGYLDGYLWDEVDDK